ncbi:MAG: hypothetical protein E6Q78_11525 [Rhodoferax sp.]|nr:MAG: hypothetical protein E6Q78_11525 [Rhodoferax sp.]
MRFFEFAPKTPTLPKPKTPDQQRVAVLQGNKDRAAEALKKERQRQQVSNAQKTIARVNASQPMQMPKPATN